MLDYEKTLIIIFYCLLFNAINAQEKNDIIKQLNKDWLAQIKFDNGYMNITRNFVQKNNTIIQPTF